jgi:cyclophilin family peptidyl-prolyl cis-trans isomerase
MMIARTVALTLLVGACFQPAFFSAGATHAREAQSASISVIRYQAETPRFKLAIEQFREQIKQMRFAEIRFHNAEASQERQLRDEFYRIRETIAPMHLELLNAGLAEYTTDPANKQLLGKALFESLERNFKKDNYDGLLPLAKGLYETRYPNPELSRIYLLCCIAANEHDQARALITDLTTSNQQLAELDLIRIQLEKLKENWESELKARERDAQGEPLPQAKIMTTKGEIVIELFENDAPEAVASFISLAEQGFYNYLDFFLVVDRFAAQTGCPNEDGTGGPGFMLPNEDDKPTARNVFRGSLVLARLPNQPNSGGSQFFFAFMPMLASEQQKYTVFGRVLSGMNNLAALNRIDPTKKKEEKENEESEEKKTTPDEIISVEILRKRDHKYEPTQLPVQGLGVPVAEPAQQQ